MIAAVREKCAGLDVHRDTVMACLMWGPAAGEAHWDVRQFGTTAEELERLQSWLLSEQCRTVVAESTGPYWEPVWNALEGSCEFRLANPQEVKSRRGHKTDKKDAWWLAHLYRHDMIRASYLPPRPVRELRLLTRRRRELVRTAAQEKNRVQKLLEQSSIKLRCVLSDVFGVSGAAMLEALLEGETDPQRIAALAKGRLSKKQAEIARALEGFRLPQAHRFLLRQTLAHLASILQQIEELDEEIQKALHNQPEFAEAAQLLETIPGMQRISAAETVAEVGPDVKAFPSPAHLSSWAGVCPGNKESAGKRYAARTTKGNPYFRATLNQSAWASSHQKQSSFQMRFERLTGRIGHRGAVVAVAHALAYAIYNVLTYRRPYKDCVNVDKAKTEQKLRHLIAHHQRRAKHLERFLPRKPTLSYSDILRRLPAAPPEA